MFEQVQEVGGMKGLQAGSPEARLAVARAALAGVQRRVGTSRDRWEAPTLPLAAGLEELLPQGLRRGRVVAVDGSTSLLLALAAGASAAGSWTAAVGMPALGAVAAARRGLDLARVGLVPHPGAHAAAALGACVDGMDVVLVGPRLALSDSDRRRLAARARERGVVILAQGEWAGAHSVLTVTASRWEGPGAGDGRLRSREVTVRVAGRHTAGSRLVRLTLDADTSLPARAPRMGAAAAKEPGVGAPTVGVPVAGAFGVGAFGGAA